MKKAKVIVTCEHASRRIPRICSPSMNAARNERDRHRIYDWGAKGIARRFSELQNAPLFEGEVTRLAIDLNRSIGHPEFFSDSVQQLSETIKAQFIARHFLPFRNQVEKRIAKWISMGNNVIHISIHSFTPCLNGQVRSVEFSVLYDESRAYEVAIAGSILSYHKNKYSFMSIIPNAPYKGIDDGHTTALRKVFPENYAGLEIEYSQGLDLVRQRDRWARDLRDSLRYALSQGERTLEFCR